MSDKKSMKHVEDSRQRKLKEWSIGGRRHFTNMLDEIMKMQKKFGSKFVNFDRLTQNQRERWTKEFVLCCYDELSEIINWTSWKHWREYKKMTKLEILEIKYEIIDLLHFILSLMLVWKMTPEEVFSMYVAKNQENFERQKKKY